MQFNTNRIDDCVLALLLLGRHDGQRVWKSFDWAAMNRLHEKGLISDPVGRAKSVVLLAGGEIRVERRPGRALGERSIDVHIGQASGGIVLSATASTGWAAANSCRTGVVRM